MGKKKNKARSYFLKKGAALLFTAALAVGFTMSGADKRGEDTDECPEGPEKDSGEKSGDESAEAENEADAQEL